MRLIHGLVQQHVGEQPRGGGGLANPPASCLDGPMNGESESCIWPIDVAELFEEMSLSHGPYQTRCRR